MTEDELSDIAVADLPPIFLYECRKLRLEENGLIPGVHDPDDLMAIGSLCVLINRLTEQGDTPCDVTINNLAVLAAALIAAHDANLPVPHLVPRWHKTLAAALQLEHVAQE
ncbi:hypothetical protein [uncultured Mycobacterium sp.]|uniref:hypothetical protein n=1 Tax=uncultured Mycobacterium sp. TaxID=171292 RepID=UPI0035CAF275